jgi:hypothetical protein
MFWFCLLLSSVAGGALFCCWLICRSHLNCRQTRSAQAGAELSKDSLLISRTASACCSILVSLEDHKSQLRNRLAMLDEMIEKSDREIERLHEQLARMNQLRSDPLNQTSREMLSLLRAGGYDEQDIEHLTLRARDELEDAA